MARRPTNPYREPGGSSGQSITGSRYTIRSCRDGIWRVAEGTIAFLESGRVSQSRGPHIRSTWDRTGSTAVCLGSERAPVDRLELGEGSRSASWHLVLHDPPRDGSRPTLGALPKVNHILLRHPCCRDASATAHHRLARVLHRSARRLKLVGFAVVPHVAARSTCRPRLSDSSQDSASFRVSLIEGPSFRPTFTLDLG